MIDTKGGFRTFAAGPHMLREFAISGLSISHISAIRKVRPALQAVAVRKSRSVDPRSDLRDFACATRSAQNFAYERTGGTKTPVASMNGPLKHNVGKPPPQFLLHQRESIS